MTSITLADIYLSLGGQSPHPSLALVSISQFVIDSRLTIDGCCFLAFRGTATDGHLFIHDALKGGAVAIIAESVPEDVDIHVVQARHDAAPTSTTKPILFLVEDTLSALHLLAAHWRSRYHPTVIGITGSVGKTSTKELLASILSRRYAAVWNEGNLNNEIGLPLSLLRIEPYHQFAILEMGFYVEGEIAQLCQLAHPQIGVITNIGPVHLERAGSMEAIFRGKAELVRALPPDGHAVLNWDDPWVRRMADLSQAPIYRYGLTPDADLWAEDIVSRGLEGIRFQFHQRLASGKVDVLHVHLPLLGRHSVHTALRAAAVGLLCGLNWEDIVNGLRNMNTQIRIDVTPGFQGSTIIDDTYNASPQSSVAALNLLHEMDGRHIAVLGDMLELGSYSEIGHRMVGRRAADVVHTLVVIGDMAAWMAEEATASGLPSAQVHHVASVAEASDLLKEIIQPGDFVLIKGSRALGMEDLVTDLSRSPDL